MSSKINCLLFILLTPLTAYQIRYLAAYVDNITLCFYRFLSGGVVLVIFLAVFRRNDVWNFLRNRRNLIILLIYTLLLIIGSIMIIQGLKLTNAITGNMFSAMSLPVTALMIYIVHREGKELISNKLFLAGIAIILLGVAGFSLSQGNFTVGGKFISGVLILLCSSVMGSVALLLMRQLLNNHDSIVVTGLTSLAASLFLLVPTLLLGDITIPLQLPAFKLINLLFSGIFGMLTGFCLSMLILKKSGTTVLNILRIVMPVSSAIFGVCFMKESLSLIQVLFGSVLLIGCYQCFSINNKQQVRL